MAILREIFAEFGIRFDRQRNLERGRRSVDLTVRTLRRVGPAAARAAAGIAQVATVAGGAAAAGLAQVVSSTVEAQRELDRWSGRLQINRDALSSWIELGREYGASVDDVTDALKELQLKAQDAISGGTSQAEMFERIGISLDDLRPVVNDVDQLMALFTNRLDDVSDAAVRNFTVDELMSDAGTRLNQVFELGAVEIENRRQALERSRGSTEQLSRTVAAHTRHMIEVRRRWERFGRELTLRVLPLIQRAESYLKDLMDPIRDLIRNTDILEGIFVGLGVTAVAVAALTISTWGPVVGVIVGVSAAVAGIATAYDQVTRTIDGADTALRRWLDDSDRLGEDGTEGVLLLLGDGWDNLGRRIGIATDYAREFYAEIQPLVTALRAIWETISFISGMGGLADAIGGAIGSPVVDLRNAAQARVAQERQREAAASRARERRIRAGERADSGVDYFGQPVSREAPIVPSNQLIREQMSVPRSGRRETNITAPMTVDIQISEATDAEETRRVVSREIEQAQSRWIRELDAMVGDEA